MDNNSNLEKRILEFNFGNWFRRNKLAVILLISLVFIGYFNSLDNAFVSDDIAGIVKNQNLGNFRHVFSGLQTFAHDSAYYLIYKIWGLNPTPYRLLGIFFHLGTVLTSFFLISILTEPTLAIIAASLFAVHPVLIEGVAWISGAFYAQYGFFIVLSLVFYLFSVQNKKLYYLSLASMVMALLSSEKAIILPFILLAFFFSYKNVLVQRGSWKKLIAPFVVSLGWIIFYLLAIPKRIVALQTGNPRPNGFLNPLWQIPIAIGSYLKLIFWPDKLTLYHSEMVFSQTQYFGYLIVFVVFLAIVFIAWKKKSPVFFWLSLFLISLLPFLTPFGISWIVAERYVYLGTLGIIVAVAAFFKKLAEKESLKTAVFIFCSLLTLSLLIRTIIRNNDWKNQDALWLAAARISPSSSQNHNNLGDLYGRQGNYPKAIEEFKKAIELNPMYADAFHNLANTYQQMHKTNLAIENYNKAIEFNPNLWQSYQNLAVIYFNQKDYAKAAQSQEKAIEISPSDASLHFNLGIIYSELDEKEKANQEFQKALDIDPGLREKLSP